MARLEVWFAGVDWASEAHHVCVVDGDGSKRADGSSATVARSSARRRGRGRPSCLREENNVLSAPVRYRSMGYCSLVDLPANGSSPFQIWILRSSASAWRRVGPPPVSGNEPVCLNPWAGRDAAPNGSRSPASTVACSPVRSGRASSAATTKGLAAPSASSSPRAWPSRRSRPASTASGGYAGSTVAGFTRRSAWGATVADGSLRRQ